MRPPFAHFIGRTNGLHALRFFSVFPPPRGAGHASHKSPLVFPPQRSAGRVPPVPHSNTPCCHSSSQLSLNCTTTTPRGRIRIRPPPPPTRRRSRPSSAAPTGGVRSTSSGPPTRPDPRGLAPPKNRIRGWGDFGRNHVCMDPRGRCIASNCISLGDEVPQMIPSHFSHTFINIFVCNIFGSPFPHRTAKEFSLPCDSAVVKFQHVTAANIPNLKVPNGWRR